MKQLIKTNLTVQLDGITPYLSTLAQIDVVFSQRKTSRPLKSDSWLSEGSTDSTITLTNDTISIPWARAETAMFKEGADFWMDIRPTLNDGTDLEIEPVQLTMNWTLFEG